MSAFLLDTLVWTGLLIVALLILRRPVTRWLGAPTAYALWALPVVRLFLPPIELPAWFAPAETMTPAAIDTALIGPMSDAQDAAGFAPIEASAQVQPSAAAELTAQITALPLAEMAMSVWMAGAAAFLFFRFGAYFRLRAELLTDAREVGTTATTLPFARPIRLIETPATAAPLAFGVFDPVIALPPGFMAQPDRLGRDLALAHELAHHRGHDLLINVAVQPLFALHWFNPLSGMAGWRCAAIRKRRAMRG